MACTINAVKNAEGKIGVIALSIKNSCGTPQPSKAIQYTTAKAGDLKLSISDDLLIGEINKLKEASPTLIIDSGKRFQLIERFGGALTDAADETFYKLPQDKQSEILNAHFDTEQRLGYSLCISHIHSSDFSGKSYSYSEIVGNSKVVHLSVSHHETNRFPFFKEVLKKANYEMKLFAPREVCLCG